ncbi:hypothetical protein GDO78_008812 [Eleutherodactylus coqui]|uniref:Uncharacterized protein n=1 Tax=Eleutherodactylus coqui TaxID=57060 RepID=A0A8J6FD73_ELECQ|nr:hypothetical protein GDO78_008812 [Eleutherodactylus coqui]
MLPNPTPQYFKEVPFAANILSQCRLQNKPHEMLSLLRKPRAAMDDVNTLISNPKITGSQQRSRRGGCVITAESLTTAPRVKKTNFFFF